MNKIITRKRFIKLSLFTGFIGSVISILYPLFSFMIPPKLTKVMTKSIEAAKSEDIKIEGYKIFRYGREPGILIRTKSGELKAFTATCTHLSCIVQYRSDLGHIWCACHNGHYNLKGTNISGPPPRPLTEFNVKEISGKIIVSKT